MNRFLNLILLSSLCVSCTSNNDPSLPDLDTATPSYDQILERRDELEKRHREVFDRYDDSDWHRNKDDADL